MTERKAKSEHRYQSHLRSVPRLQRDNHLPRASELFQHRLVAVLPERRRAVKATLVFPTILIALDIGAAVVYAACGHYIKAVYWCAAATLTACVTY